jgi:hypothetical protein
MAASEERSIGRDTINSMSSKLRVKEPSKDTSNALSPRPDKKDPFYLVLEKVLFLKKNLFRPFSSVL